MIKHISESKKEEMKGKIRKILTEKDEVIFAYLHGSFNEIYFRDVDIAVYKMSLRKPRSSERG